MAETVGTGSHQQFSRDEGPFRPAIDTIVEDRTRAEILLAGEHRILEMIARGDSLGVILDALCRLVQESLAAAKQAEDQIRQHEREFRQIVEAIPAFILVLSPQGDPLYGNQALLGYAGLVLDDVQAKDFRERIFHPEDLERVQDERRRWF